MENARFLRLVIIVLLLINIGTLVFIWVKPSPGSAFPPHREDTFIFLTRELKLSTEQQHQYEQMRDEHHEAMEIFNRRNRDLHDRFFNLLSSPTVDSALVKSVVDSITANEQQEELITFYHFKHVRGICTPDQQKKFDEVINEALRMMAPKPPPPPR